MKKSRRYLAMAIMLFLTCLLNEAVAQPTIDGNASGDGYTSFSIQNTNTQFGDGTGGDPINGGGGSEIDQVFMQVANDGFEDRLYVVIAGNLETNFNKLDVFIDSESGVGQNTLDGSTLPVGVDSFFTGNFSTTDGALQQMGGTITGTGLEKITFDAGFGADYYLTFTNGYEDLRPGLPSQRTFYAASAHYAELNNGPTGDSFALGMQLAHRGLPNVLRGTTGDFDTDGTVDGGEFMTWIRNNGLVGGATRAQGDGTGDGVVNGNDLTLWRDTYRFDVANTTFADFPFLPQDTGDENSDALLGPALPGLNQGELIDRDYAIGAGGCDSDDSGNNCETQELEFALDIDTLNDPSNTFKHRNMDNAIDLRMAFDNSNIEGVNGDGGTAPFFSTPTAENPGDVTTGVEFSIPLSAIGNPGPGDSIKLTAFVNGGSHNFLSNQVSGVGVLSENIGPPGFANFSFIAGDQFVELVLPVAASAAVPEPSTLMLVCLSAIAGGLARRRR